MKSELFVDVQPKEISIALLEDEEFAFHCVHFRILMSYVKIK